MPRDPDRRPPKHGYTVDGVPYAVYIKSEQWAKVKRHYWASKLPKVCIVCGSGERLDLHHRTYKNLGRERLMDLVPLCRRCHDLTHEVQKETRGSLWAAHKIVRRRLPKAKRWPGVTNKKQRK